MAAPIVVVLNHEYAEQVWRHLVLRNVDRPTVDDIAEALKAAARFETVPEPEPDLFGGAS